MRKIIWLTFGCLFGLLIFILTVRHSGSKESTKNREYLFGECEVILQVLESQGDGGSDVVNLYARKPTDIYYPKWRWYYVDHESRFGGWSINGVGGGNIVVADRFHEVYRLSLNSFEYYKKGRLFSKGGSLVVDPYKQGYPVEKDDIFLR